MRQALRVILLGDTAIAAQVATRVYPLVMAQGERGDSLVYQRISGFGEPTLSGPNGLVETRFQIDAYAVDIDRAAALADLVKARLDGYSGIVPYGEDSPAATVNVRGIFFDAGPRDSFESDQLLYRVGQDFMVHHAG